MVNYSVEALHTAYIKNRKSIENQLTRLSASESSLDLSHEGAFGIAASPFEQRALCYVATVT